MRSSRRSYHYAVRFIRKQESLIRKSNFLNSLMSGGHDFFREVKKYRGQKQTPSNTMNGECGDDSKIAQTLNADEYQSLYNSCDYDPWGFPDTMLK